MTPSRSSCEDGHSVKYGVAGLERLGPGDGGILDVVWNVQVDAAVLMFAVFFLQSGDELAERLAFFGHHVGEKQTVEQAVALGQVTLEADAAGFFAAHDDFALEHEVNDILEADAVFDELAAIFPGDAVEHFGGVEGAGDCAGPAFALQHPTEKNRIDLVGIDEVAVLVGGADAVGIAVGAQAGLATVGAVASPSARMFGSMGSGLMPGKRGSGLARICTWSTPIRLKMSARMVLPAPYMESMQNSILDFAMRSRSAKPSMALR